MDSIDDKRAKSELAYWIKHFSFMKESEFNSIDMSDFTTIQRMAYNYVDKSKTDTKITDKIIELMQWYDVDSKWSV